MRNLPFLLFFLFLTTTLYAQRPTPAAERMAGYEMRQKMAAESQLGGLEFTNIGPTIMSGRVTDLAVNPDQPTEFYVAYASGGLWHTNNNGLSFTPLFQEEAVMTIGAIDVHWPTKTIYLGSGEVNSSRSSYAGNGVYKSTDGGKSWSHLGLEETHHIGTVIVADENPDMVWVAALGHLYGPNPERGLYKSMDGGENWTKTLYVDENSGVVEARRDPSRPNVIYAASWERSRRAWDFDEAGPGSGIWKSTDYGDSWELLTDADSGFPSGEGTGRIGLTLPEIGSNGERAIYASLDNYNRRPAEDEDTDRLTTSQLKTMSVEEIVGKEEYVLNDFLRQNGFPRSMDVKKFRGQLEDGSLTVDQITDYLTDANSQLFDTPVIGLEIYKSTDDGATWTKTHDDYLNGVYNSYGYYFGQVRVNPKDDQQLYAMGVPIIRSDDGGKTWKGVNGANVHSDHHSLWINPENPAHIINGNDGGVNISYDYGETWFKANSPSVGQFYSVAVDNHPDGYRVYGGLQDNGVWRGPHDYEYSDGWHGRGSYPYESIMGGDGMQVAIDSRDNETVYTGFQFGNYFRINTEKGERSYITPRHELGQSPYRWNWQAPIHLSIHQPDILYMGSNFLHRSLNQGRDWETISSDLTLGSRPGDVPFGTLATIHESPLRFGLLYTGSDDGLVHLSRDGGFSWQNISRGLPHDLWVSRVQASAHEEGRVYVTLNGYRTDDFNAYVYVSENYGRTWTQLGKDLPAEPVNVIREDPANADLLYVGTDHGLYISLDRGETFDLIDQIPKVAVHDLAIQAQEKDLIVGTHGRSFYRADIDLLQQLKADTDEIMVVGPDPIRASSRWGRSSFNSRSNDGPRVDFVAFSPAAAKAEISVSLKKGPIVNTYSAELEEGINTVAYDLTVAANRVKELEAALNKDRKKSVRPVRLKAADNEKIYVTSGTYLITVKVGEEEKTVELTVK